MKKTFITSALLSIIASSAFADIKVITTKIDGTGYEVNGIVNIAKPTILVGEAHYSLYANETTAAQACISAGMILHSYQATRMSDRTTASIAEGAVRLLNSSNKIQILSCKPK